MQELSRGGVIAYPTENAYALGVDPLLPGTLAKLDAMKGERAAKAYPLLIADFAWLKKLAVVTPTVCRLAEGFWPGPLTLVVTAAQGGRQLAAPDGTLGVRMSRHPIAQTLVAKYGRAITCTSANRSNQPAARSVAELCNYFGDQLLIVDDGDLPAGKPSTVVRVNGDLQVERSGPISQAEILARMQQ